MYLYLQIEELEQKYGGPLISRRAACKIQMAFRQYQLSKNFQKIRNSVLESGIPRRMSVRRVRVQRDGFSAERALMEGCSLMGIPLTHSTSLPGTTTTTITHLEDTFTEQVQIHHQHLLAIQLIYITVFHEFKYTNDSVLFMLFYCLILLYLVLFCLFLFVLFQSTQICCSVLVYVPIVFHSNLFKCYFLLHSVLFILMSVLFSSNMLFYSVLLYPVLFKYVVLFCSIVFNSIWLFLFSLNMLIFSVLFCSILLKKCVFCYIWFYSIQFMFLYSVVFSILFKYLVLLYLIFFHSV